MHVLKYLVRCKVSPTYAIISRKILCDFPLTINYTGGFDDNSF